MTVDEGAPVAVEAERAPVAVGGDGAPKGVDAAAAVAPRHTRRRMLRRGPRRAGRRRPRARVVALVAVLVIGGLVGTRYRAAKADLADTRAQLAEVRADLASEQDALTLSQRRAELTQAGIDQVRADIEDEVAGRTWLEAVTASTLAEIAVVEEDRAETDAARLLVAANSNDALACFGGVSAAVGASRRGDAAASVAALRGGADQCSRTLAFATGARFPYDFADPFVLRAGTPTTPTRPTWVRATSRSSARPTSSPGTSSATPSAGSPPGPRRAPPGRRRCWPATAATSSTTPSARP